MRTHNNNFIYYDAGAQHLFFKNATWMATSIGVRKCLNLISADQLPEGLLIDHDVELQQPAFKVIEKGDGSFDIEVLHQECLFFNFLIQTSRVRYNQEMAAVMKLSDADRAAYLEENKFSIAGPLLPPEHQDDQKQILISKIFALGYLMQRYKDRATPWAVVVSDQMLMNDGRTLGGTGKTLCFVEALSKVVKPVFKLNGRDPKILTAPFKYAGLTQDHRLIVVDDSVPAIKIRAFFETISGDILVNQRGKESLTLPFENSPKTVLIYESEPEISDVSTMRRVLPVVFSDYYHNRNEEYGYTFSRTPKDDFGKNLFIDFNEADYNHFFTTMANCLSYRLSIRSPYVMKTKTSAI